jgi:hypothetical protein
MSDKEHKEFNESVLRQLCEEASKTLPTVDPSAAWEPKAEIVLNHLKNKVIGFCGVPEGFNFQNVSGFPRYSQLVSEIVGIIDFDVVQEHGSYKFFYKAPIVMQYVIDIIGVRELATGTTN